MYLGQTIDEILTKKKERLLGLNTPFYITSVLDRAFKKHGLPITFKLETFSDYRQNDYSVGGIYNGNTDQCLVVLYFSKYKKFYMSKSRWDRFKFVVSQTCQHELVHKIQNQHREDPDEIEPIDLRSLQQEEGEDEKDYLADKDEIDAYAHDIAMEIRKYYPFSDPYHILRTINKRTRLDAYQYYCKTFENDDWLSIRKLLLKKTYKWLPHVTYTRD